MIELDRHSNGDHPEPGPIDADVLAFPRLDDAQLEAFVAAGRPRSLAAGETIFALGDLDYDLVVPLSGRVTIGSRAGRAGEGIVAALDSRQFVGELNLWTGEPADLSAVVEESGEALALNRSALHDLVARYRALADLILAAFVARRALMVDTGGGTWLVGSRDAPRSHELRELLVRNRVPHRFTEVESAPGATLVRELAIEASDLPLLIGGAHALRDPTVTEAGDALDLEVG